MKKIDSLGLSLCKSQAEIFERSITFASCGSGVFIRRYMLSDFARRMDKGATPFESLSTEGAVHEIISEYGETEYGKTKYNPDEMYWMGYIYRYWSYTASMPSKNVYRLIKPSELKALYFPYHSLDPAQAIERIIEAKGLKEEDEIERGVRILRRIKNRENRE